MKMKILAAMSVALLTTCNFATDKETDYQVISVLDITKEQFEANKGHPSGKIAFEFPAGYELPVTLKSQEGALELMSNHNEPYHLKFNEKIYVKIEPKELYFSKDLTTWKTISEFFSGNFGFTTNVDTVGVKSLDAHFKLDVR